ncbi:sigma factor [Modestobacter sp. VKM Ac-2977]|uniref:RNA polymerase sigma factor n=1 Tax=Modestobacter sp. VKM Ac-2977 TaxID=3004131 RepID=UPI0022AAAAF0|nr:sigma factor [Modestobacter sp. VKM Ac-2977]MCZ2821326.1 sigma factor [Modestobacter sp. VKM Ac-2977]
MGDLADDLLSETFLIAFRRRSAYRAVHVEVRPWLLGIATQLVHGQQRTEQRRLRALSRTAPLAPALPADDDLSDRLTAQALRGPIAAALAGLKAADRDVLLLFAWEQLTYEGPGQSHALPGGHDGEPAQCPARRATVATR